MLVIELIWEIGTTQSCRDSIVRILFFPARISFNITCFDSRLRFEQWLFFGPISFWFGLYMLLISCQLPTIVLVTYLHKIYLNTCDIYVDVCVQHLFWRIQHPTTKKWARQNILEDTEAGIFSHPLKVKITMEIIIFWLMGAISSNGCFFMVMLVFRCVSISTWYYLSVGGYVRDIPDMIYLKGQNRWRRWRSVSIGFI